MKESKAALLRLMGRQLRAAREGHGWTQSQLAEKFGQSQSAISGYENGTRMMHAEELLTAAQLLGVSVGYLFGIECVDVEVQAVLLKFLPPFRVAVLADARESLEAQEKLWQIVTEIGDGTRDST
jgi:transcriptional regulator with XRE-family HTH domain